MSSSSGVENGVRDRGIVRRHGGRGGRGIGRVGLGGRGGGLETPYVQDCTFTARLPCQWVIQDM
jgi:hypothetical protein